MVGYMALPCLLKPGSTLPWVPFVALAINVAARVSVLGSVARQAGITNTPRSLYNLMGRPVRWCCMKEPFAVEYKFPAFINELGHAGERFVDARNLE